MIISPMAGAFHRAAGAARRAAAWLLVLGLAACANFHAVEEGRMYRSAQPDERQLTRWIWRYQIESVVRLRNGDERDEDFLASYEPTVAAGIDFYKVPLSAKRFPDRERLVQLCEIFERARYPILVHCQAGADRSGLVSAMYMLYATGDMEKAREQLSFIPYLHLGWFGLDKPDRVLDMYEPWHPDMSFCEWARKVYEKPPDNALPPGFVAAERERAARWRAGAGATEPR